MISSRPINVSDFTSSTDSDLTKQALSNEVVEMSQSSKLSSHAENNSIVQFQTDIIITMDIFQAAKNGKITQIKRLIENGYNINVQDKYRYTPLAYAASNGHLEVAQYLLNHGAEVDLTDKFDSSPLQLAVLKNHEEIVKILLNNGADPLKKNKIGPSALSLAAVNSNIELLEILINYLETYNISIQRDLMLSAVAGIIDNNENAWKTIEWLHIKYFLNKDDQAKSYEGIRELLLENHWIYADRYDEIINCQKGQ